VRDYPYPMANGNANPTYAIAEGLFGVLEHMAEHLTDLENKGRALTANYQHLDEQISLATQIQRALLPHESVASTGAELRTVYRPVDRVSGDIYDIVRLDETRLGISLADATGHGVGAALLTVFIKRIFQGKEIENGSYRIVPPDEILRRLNRELLGMRLRQCPYVTALHAVYDESQRRLTFARGGMPLPVYVPVGGTPRQIGSGGPLVGAFADSRFETVEMNLAPGDRILFFTDGLSALLCGRNPQAPSHDLTQIPSFAEALRLPIDSFLTHIHKLIDHTPSSAWHGDDITLIALDVTSGGGLTSPGLLT
jgi:sigma-B regulation protein RsbU (phosphoserine phosphatase)